uniref:Tc1-like transposase DDE domain-containing protein n=1 Tax=Pygocentrus nattereri TaxID=42514 RepID=A0AAR2KFA0_PYGNA
ARNLGISSSTVHNIIKRFRESGEISARKRQGRKPTLNACDIPSLRRHCTKIPHHSVKDITTWAQEHFRKPLSVNTVRRSTYKCKLKLCHKRCRLLCVLWSDESTFHIVFGNHGRRVLWAKKEKDCPDCFQCKVQKPASLMVWGCVSAHGMGNLHICEGTINAERYIQVLEQHMLPSKQPGTFPEFFQQDVAPPHYGCQVQAFLDEQFPGKWIGRRGPVEWPPRSPDLTPLDSYLWGHLKTLTHPWRTKCRFMLMRVRQLLSPAHMSMMVL